MPKLLLLTLKLMCFVLPFFIYHTFGMEKYPTFSLDGAEKTYINGQDKDDASWGAFIEHIKDTNPEPALATQELMQQMIFERANANWRILDIGCETGKNAIPLAKLGHKLTLLDITPNAIKITIDKFEKLSLDDHIEQVVIGPIENLPEIKEFSDFDAIIGTYVFPFIHPRKFSKIMAEKIFSRIKVGGYFAGHFWGKNHAWASLELTTHTEQELKDFFEKNGFQITFFNEASSMKNTPRDGLVVWHDFTLVACKKIDYN